MEFWGVEVKPGQSLKVEPEDGKLIHISQAALGVVKDVKGAKYVPLRMKIDSRDFVLGSLAAEDRTQLMFDLVFEKEFELSHDWKNGSVFFAGYIADDPDSVDGQDFSDMSDDDESEDELVHNHENGKCDHKEAIAAPAAAAGSKKEAKAAAKKEETSDSDDDEIDSDDSDEDMALSGEEDGLSGEDSDEDDDDSIDDSEVEKFLNAKESKKRSAEPAKETPVPAKKAKSATPDTGNKKSHTATPFPSKASGKTAAGKKSNEKTPKSGGQPTCKPCSKTFTSESALLSHSKAKHGGK